MPGIAILGAGLFAKEAHLPSLAKIALAQTAPFELKAVYSRSQASAESLAAAAQRTLSLPAPPQAYFDIAEDGHPALASLALDALLTRGDVAGVVVVLPITHQPGVILRALAAGKHVLSEKPVAPDVQSGRQLIATYRAEYVPKGLIWRVGENFEADDVYRTAGAWVKDGEIGQVQQFEVRVVNHVDENSKWYKTPWRTVPDYQGGFLLDGGVHTAAALRVILDAPLASLSGHASLAKKILAPHDTLTASLQTTAGAHGTLHMTFGAPHPGLGAALGGGVVAVVGAAGWVTVARAEVGGKTVDRATLTRVAKNGKGEVATETKDFESRGVELELVSWLNALEGKDDGLGLGDPRNALLDVALIEACLKSEGRSINLVKLVATGELV